MDLQDKIRKIDPDTSLDDLKQRISEFLRRKLGKQAECIMEDLNNFILEVPEKSSIVTKSISLRSLNTVTKR